MKWAIDARQDFSFSLPAELCNVVQTPYTVRKQEKETTNKEQKTRIKMKSVMKIAKEMIQPLED